MTQTYILSGKDVGPKAMAQLAGFALRHSDDFAYLVSICSIEDKAVFTTKQPEAFEDLMWHIIREHHDKPSYEWIVNARRAQYNEFLTKETNQ